MRRRPGSGQSQRSHAGWRLLGAPGPTYGERLSRAVGLRVFRMPGARRVLVVAGSVDRLRDLLDDPVALAPTRTASIVVIWWRPPRRGWSGGIGPLEGTLQHRVSLPIWRRGAATVGIRLARPVRLREIVRAALPALGAGRSLPGPASAKLTSHGPPPAYLPAQADTSVFLGDLPASPDIRAHDVVLLGAGTAAPPVDATRYAVGCRTFRHGLVVSGGAAAVLVDARRVNPRGRRPAAYRADAPRVRLDFDRPGSALLSGRRAPGGTLDGPGLDAAALAALRRVGVVDCPTVPDGDPAGTAALLVQVAMTGAVLHVPVLPRPVADLIAPELRQIIAAGLPTGDELTLEARSVRQRRAAMRGHATAFALPGLTAGAFPELSRPPSVSVILASRRPEMLATALARIAAQTYPELEIIVCLHGIEPPDELRVRLARCGRPVEVLTVPATASFGVALGEATRRARGTLVTKFDDDDSYGTEHVWDLVLARHYSGATLVGKGAEFVHLETSGSTVRRPSGIPEADGELVAGGTMLLAKGDLEAVGGWRPVPRSVDHGLIDRLRRDGAVIFRTHPLGYVYHRREGGHTWDPGLRYFLDTAFAQWSGIPDDVFADPRQPPPGRPAVVAPTAVA